jgi:hypothetical protein
MFLKQFGFFLRVRDDACWTRTTDSVFPSHDGEKETNIRGESRGSGNKDAPIWEHSGGLPKNPGFNSKRLNSDGKKV